MTYIIFTPDLGLIGGAQLYAIRRAKFLVQNGYEVKFITTNYNSLMLDDLNAYPVLKVELPSLIKYLSQKKRQELERRVIGFIHKADIIESHTLNDAVFCEILAEKLGIKHVVYLLNEFKLADLRDKALKSFFEYKLKRHELFGITNQSLSIVFNGEITADENRFVNVPFDRDEIISYNAYFFPIVKSQKDFIIATIGRLEKSYIEPLISGVFNWASTKDITVHLVVYGDSSDKFRQPLLRRKYQDNEHVKLYLPGYINPIPKSLFSRINVFAGVGTAVVNSISQSCPTLVIDPRTGKCAGILGRDITNFGYSENDRDYSIEQKLDEIQNMSSAEIEELKTDGRELFENEFEKSRAMCKLDDFIRTSAREKEYWRFSFKYSLVELIYVFLISLNLKNHNTFFRKIKTLFN